MTQDQAAFAAARADARERRPMTRKERGAAYAAILRNLDAELADGKHELTLRTSDKKNAESKGHAARIVNFLAN